MSPPERNPTSSFTSLFSLRYFRAGLLVLLLAAGCGGTFRNQIHTYHGPIYVGMSGDKIQEVLGPPQEVGQGPYGCRYSGRFFGFMINSNEVIEWAWPDNGRTLVAYLVGNQVQRLGIVQ